MEMRMKNTFNYESFKYILPYTLSDISLTRIHLDCFTFSQRKFALHDAHALCQKQDSQDYKIYRISTCV